MNRFAQNMGLRPGDVILTPKSDFRLVRHYVVYGGVNHLGQEFYYENNWRYGVRCIDGDTFARENPEYFSIRRFQGNEIQRQWAMHRAQSSIGTGYNLLTFNCEHFANFVQYNNVSSGQVQGSGIAAAILLLLCCI